MDARDELEVLREQWKREYIEDAGFDAEFDQAVTLLGNSYFIVRLALVVIAGVGIYKLIHWAVH